MEIITRNEIPIKRITLWPAHLPIEILNAKLLSRISKRFNYKAYLDRNIRSYFIINHFEHVLKVCTDLLEELTLLKQRMYNKMFHIHKILPVDDADQRLLHFATVQT